MSKVRDKKARASERERRLAAALRANLRRRKAQERARGAARAASDTGEEDPRPGS
ncbi:MAG: hypothetical protein ACE5ED_10050 [Rhodothalassiaceae bacterium]